MASMELFSHLIGINLSKFSKEEINLLEGELFIRICDELKEVFRKQYKDYFYLMKFTIEKENIMLETNFVRLIIKDILATEEYSAVGIAHYADTHEDVIQEVIDGRNSNPSARLLRRSIDLHRTVRRELYNSIIKKITAEFLAIV